MLTNEQIEELCPKMGVPMALVCFKNELPRKLQYNKTYFINMEDSHDSEGRENEGSHWTMLQVNKYPNDKIEPFYFDSYGEPPSENIKNFVKNNCSKGLPYNTSDIQSLMNNACGWYCLALSHFINGSQYKSGDLYSDVETFLSMFDNLNEKVDWKKNEYILKQFFQPKDPSLRKEIDVLANPNAIMNDDEKSSHDMMKLGVDIKMMN